MNRDYAYCVGPNYFGGAGTLRELQKAYPFQHRSKRDLDMDNAPLR